MKIAIYGDSFANPDHFKYSLKYNPKLTTADKDLLWYNRLLADGHEIDFYASNSRHVLWVDDIYNKTKDNYDKRIIRCFNWNMPLLNVPDYEEVLKRDFLDFAPNLRALKSKKIDKSKQSVQAVQTYYEYFCNTDYNARVFRLLINDWLQDPDTLFISPILLHDSRFKIPSPTPWVQPEQNILQERNEWMDAVSKRHNKEIKYKETDASIYIFHKHPNHVPIHIHENVYSHIKHWIETGDKNKPIEIDKWYYYEDGCKVCGMMEEELLCQLQD